MSARFAGPEEGEGPSSPGASGSSAGHGPRQGPHNGWRWAA